ncbi:MAG: thioredoxin-disulfide reductase [Candidatus Omnitrophica bacterium]|nr:thioredoxin-disulfide reductase [Candidatus Omnitrophota bacterium]
MYEVIIVGAGPAGLTAALYCARARLKTLLIEKMAVGGRILMSERIENYPGFAGGVSTHELIGQMEKQVKELDVAIEADEVIQINCVDKKIKTSSSEYQAGSIILACGARPRKLNVPGEEKLTGRGVSYCATCDAPFYKEKHVVVVGGGNAVAEEALYLSRFARKVTILHRRKELRATPIMQERLQKNERIDFILGAVLLQIQGTQKVESVILKDVTSGNEKSIACDGVFIYIGYEPETDFLKDTISLDEKGFIITQEDMSTTREGIFACGDCRKKSLYQVVTACADGAIAADSAYKYITQGGI